MGNRKTSYTAGYWYSMTALFGLCHGKVDSLRAIVVDSKDAFRGEVTDAAPYFTVGAAKLFGGEDGEGGYAGPVYFNNGEVGNDADGFMASIPAPRPRYTGLTTLLFYKFAFSAMTQYLKPPSFEVVRIHEGWSGDVEWYPEKAEIVSTLSLSQEWEWGTLADVTKDSETPEAYYIAAGTLTANSSLAALHYDHEDTVWHAAAEGGWGWDSGASAPQPGNNAWPGAAALYLRQTITLDAPKRLMFSGNAENSMHLFVNGVKRGSNNPTNAQVSTSEAIAFSIILELAAGENEVVIVALDENTANPAGSSTLLEVTVSEAAGGNAVTGADMNPAHIIYQCLTDPEWGMGYPTADIDDTSFMAAADTLYTEGFGISIGWFEQSPIDDFVQLILNHIDGVVRVNPSTGKLELKLLRDDYDIETCEVIDTSNIVELSAFSRAAWGDLVNEVVLNYSDYAGETQSIRVQDLAAAEVQEAIVSQSVDMPGIHSDTLAARVAQRELLRRSRTLAQATVTVNRTVSSVRPGDVVVFEWAPLGITSLPMRVMAVDRGTLEDGTLKLSLTEDMFALPSTVFTGQQGSLGDVQMEQPADPQHLKVVEWPYYSIQTELSPGDASTLVGGECLGQILVGAENTLAYGFNTVLSDDGVNYAIGEHGDFSPYGRTTGATSRTTTSVTLTGARGLADIEYGGYGYLGDEVVRVDNVAGSTLTLGRGCLDTLPQEHAEGTLFIFATGAGVVDATERVESTTAYYKALPITSTGALDEGDAAAHSVTFANRAERPYPPANVQLNSATFPATISGTLTVSWAHRDRTQQLADIADWLDGDIGPETGVTYTLMLYNQNGVLVRTETGLTDTSYTWVTETTDSELESTVSLLNFNGADASTSMVDVVGNSWTALGDAQLDTAQKKFGTASLLLDGAGDYIETGGLTGGPFDIGGGDFTIECWVRVSSLPASVRPIFTQGSGVSTNGYYFGITAAGNPFFDVYGTSFTGTDAAMSGGAWSHMAVTRQGTTVRMFVDGALAGSATYANWSHAEGSARIGRGRGTSTGYWTGWVDGFRLTKGVARYTAAFTPPAAELLMDYTASLLHFDGTDAATTFTDAAYERTWTAAGNAQLDTDQKQFGTASLLLDGTGDYLSATGVALAGQSQWTVEMFVRLDTLAPTYSPLFYNGSSGSDDHRISLYIAADGSLNTYLQAGGGTGANTASDAGLVVADTWHHVALTRDGTSFKAYVDGALALQSTYATTINDSTNWFIGLARAGGAAVTTTQGWIDEFRVSLGIVRYTGTFSPPTEAFDLSTGSSLNTSVRVRLKTERDGLESLNEFDWTVAR